MSKINKTTGLPIEEAWLFWIAIAAMIVIFGLPMIGINVSIPTSVESIYNSTASLVP